MVAIAVAIAAGALALLIVVSSLRRQDRINPVALLPQISHVRVIPAAQAEDRDSLERVA